MEIPTKLKALYKHLTFHTTRNIPTKDTKTQISKNLFNEILQFAQERMRIWEKKTRKDSPPYTRDEILQKYRFCNIYRELDRQTIEIHSMLKVFEDQFDLWLLNLLFNRFVCKPETVKKIGFLNFCKMNNKKVLERLQSLERPKYGSAYVFPISLIQKTRFPTREEFFCLYIPTKIQSLTKLITDFRDKSVIEALELILPEFGFNFRFHWTEILIDIAYQYPEHINLFKEFPIGPGAEPTLKRFSNADPVKTCMHLASLKPKSFPYLEYNGKNVLLSSENWEGIACEFRKYSNLKKGKGRRRIYTP